MENNFPRSLFHYNQEFIMLMDSIQDSTDPEALELLRIAEENVKGKALNYCHRITDNEGDIGKIDAEIKRLQDRKKSIISETDRLKRSLLNAVELFGDQKPKSEAKEIDLTTFKVTWLESTSMEIQNPSELPPIYMKDIPPAEEPDKAAIKAELMAGNSVPGAILIRKRNLQIK